MVKMVPGDTNTLGLTATQRAGGSARPGLPPHLINPIQLLAKIRITPEAPRLTARTTVVTQLVMEKASGAIPLTRPRDGSYATFHHAQIIASKAMVKGLLGDTQFVGISVMPDFLHVVPIGDDAVFDRVFQGENTSFGLSLVADVAVFVAHSHHDSRVFGSASHRRKHGARGVITGESRLAHAGAIVDDQSGRFFVVAHF